MFWVNSVVSPWRLNTIYCFVCSDFWLIQLYYRLSSNVGAHASSSTSCRDYPVQRSMFWIRLTAASDWFLLSRSSLLSRSVSSSTSYSLTESNFTTVAFITDIIVAINDFIIAINEFSTCRVRRLHCRDHRWLHRRAHRCFVALIADW